MPKFTVCGQPLYLTSNVRGYPDVHEGVILGTWGGLFCQREFDHEGDHYVTCRAFWHKRWSTSGNPKKRSKNNSKNRKEN